jgi:hypothetical protein
VLALLLGVLSSACERGCAWRALSRAGIASDGTGSAQAWLGLGEVDCPDGLARCRGGVIEASRLARRPSPCRGNLEACACPWAVAGRCEGQCVADDLEVLLPGERASSQLCAPDPARVAFARPPAPVTALTPLGGACEAEAFVCLGSAVVACRPAPRIVATCASGCSSQEPLGGRIAETLSDAQAVAVLCTR